MIIESIIYTTEFGKRKFLIELSDQSTGESINIDLRDGKWDNSIVVNALIRSKYSQDRVEAIINNHFLNIADWLDKKFKGEEVKFEDKEYENFQIWRDKCKKTSPMILEAIENFIK